MGISMGGYLAARAAAFEHRIAACVLYNGLYDRYDAFAAGFPQLLRVAVENGDVNVVNTVIDILSDMDLNMRFNLKHDMWTTGTNSPFELIQGSKKYTVKGIAQKIKCPTLVLDAEKDDHLFQRSLWIYRLLVEKPGHARYSLLHCMHPISRRNRSPDSFLS
jgi:hypothetical protein